MKSSFSKKSSRWELFISIDSIKRTEDVVRERSGELAVIILMSLAVNHAFQTASTNSPSSAKFLPTQILNRESGLGGESIDG